MNQRPFSPVTNEPFKVENYYFQLILQRLIPKRGPTAGAVQFTFTPYKGTQKYESSKPITLQLGSNDAYPLDNAKLNFVAISYNPAKNLSFAVRMIANMELTDKEVGEYMLDANNYIDHFMQSQNGAFTIKLDFNDDWAAEGELYVERTRYGVERLIRQIKNPKPKEDGEAAQLSHQAITEKRKKMDLQEQEEEQAPHHHKFKKFSPRRDSQEENNKKNQYFNRKNQETTKQVAAPPPPPPPPKKEEKEKKIKGEFVPKKEWIIPEAEKYIANKTKSSSRSNSIRETRMEEKSASEVKEEPRRKPKPAEDPSLVEKLPMQPKYIVMVAILMVILFASSFFLKADPPQAVLKGHKQPKPKKGEEKVEKPLKGKVKK